MCDEPQGSDICSVSVTVTAIDAFWRIQSVELMLIYKYPVW